MNERRGESLAAVVELDRPRTLKFNLNAACAFEGAVGEGFVAFGRRVAESDATVDSIPFRHLRALVWAGLRHEPDAKQLTLERVGDLMEEHAEVSAYEYLVPCVAAIRASALQAKNPQGTAAAAGNGGPGTSSSPSPTASSSSSPPSSGSSPSGSSTSSPRPTSVEPEGAPAS